MRRRSAVGLAVLLVALLAGVVLPLLLTTAAAERSDFRSVTVDAARSVAATAEEHIDEGQSATAADAALRGEHLLVPAGDRVLLVGRTGLLASGGVTGGPGPARIRREVAGALAGRVVSGWVGSDDTGWLVVAVPVTAGTRHLAAAVLERPAGSLDSALEGLDRRVAAGAAGVVVVGALLGWLLVRWLTDPVRALHRAVGELGDGRLDRRAPADRGPAELRELAGAVNAMAVRLEALVGAHRSMIADVSHQLRTPLAAVRLRLELLEQDTDPATAAEVAGALAELGRLSRLLDGLLAAARAENATVRRGAVRVAAVVAGRIEAWQPVAAERAVRLAAEGDPGLSALTTEGHLEQVLDNLLANALDATPAGGAVTVATAAEAGHVRIDVADTGPGMPAHRREVAFDRFHSGRADSGTGLGLAIVHRLVGADGGTVRLGESAAGGLLVQVRLPAAAARSPAAAAPSAP